MNEVHRLVYMLGMPACFLVNLSQQTFTGVQFKFSEYYKDMDKTSRTRDMKDTCRLLDALKQWNPCAPNTSLYGLVNGLTANEGANVDNEGITGCMTDVLNRRLENVPRSINSK